MFLVTVSCPALQPDSLYYLNLMLRLNQDKFLNCLPMFMNYFLHSLTETLKENFDIGTGPR